jgi:hypothetical protein
MAKAGLPRQYDVGGPSQPTGRLQGKKPKKKISQQHGPKFIIFISCL